MFGDVVLIIKKLNESFSFINKLSEEEIQKLIIRKQNYQYNYMAQMNSYYSFERFFKKIENGYIVPNGILEYLGYYKKPEIPSEYRNKLEDIVKSKCKLEARDYQLNAIIDALVYKKLFIRAATGAGKSLIIGLIIKLLIDKGLKGILVVPNVSLTNQFKSDLESYELDIDFNVIGGTNSAKDLTKPLTITTWQSLKNVQNLNEILKNIGFIIVDEAHGAKADVIFNIVNKCINTEYKIGLTGTIPEGEVNVMRLQSVFGNLMNYITPRGLIERGLATEAKVKMIYLMNEKIQGDYPSQLKVIKESYKRTRLISSITDTISEKGNTLVLFQHTKHGLDLFYEILKIRNVEYNDKTYKDLVQQKINNIFFINGLIDGEQREIVRNILEKAENAILVANYATLSTGVNIKKLNNLILASPLKSYVTITQSLGRLLRTHESKSIVNIFDIVDNSTIFRRQAKERIEKSYEPEGYEIEKINYVFEL